METTESRFFITSADTSIHVRVTQPAENTRKPLLVFLHYWGGTSSTWHKLTTPDSPTSLSKQYPTIAVDLRGWGQSIGPSEDGGSTYSVSSMASDIVSVLAQLKTNEGNLLNHGLILVGHSMGAKVALATLGLLPLDLSLLVNGLVLIAPAPPTSLNLPSEMKAQQQVAYESEESIRWTIQNVLSNPAKLTISDIEMITLDSLGGSSLAKKAWPSYGMQEDVSQSVKRALARKSFSLVKVLVGSQDVVEPKERVETEVVGFLKATGFEVSMEIVMDAKHLIPLEEPEVLYRAIQRF
jgi:pimeloyl-ACP methyl ester carboxylesterase